jgi:2,3-bisphosphoglycerate-independent phosphoglycerate mutase
VPEKLPLLSAAFFSMDRDNRWDRVEQAYRLMTEGHAALYSLNPLIEGLEAAYEPRRK